MSLHIRHTVPADSRGGFVFIALYLYLYKVSICICTRPTFVFVSGLYGELPQALPDQFQAAGLQRNGYLWIFLKIFIV